MLAADKEEEEDNDGDNDIIGTVMRLSVRQRRITTVE